MMIRFDIYDKSRKFASRHHRTTTAGAATHIEIVPHGIPHRRLVNDNTMTSREEREVPLHTKQQGGPNAILPASGLPFLMCFVQDVSPFSVYFLSIACYMPSQYRGIFTRCERGSGRPSPRVRDWHWSQHCRPSDLPRSNADHLNQFISRDRPIGETRPGRRQPSRYR